jgi:hypothetical protein
MSPTSLSFHHLPSLKCEKRKRDESWKHERSNKGVTKRREKILIEEIEENVKKNEIGEEEDVKKDFGDERA